MTWEIRVLDLGEVELDGSRTVITRPPGKKVRVPVLAFLLLGDRGPILVDSGFRNPEILTRLGMRGFQSEEQRLERRLAAHGLGPADLELVIYTHLHIDHGGHPELFPLTVPFVINRRELEYSVSGLSGPSYPPEDIKPLIDRLHTKNALTLLDTELTGGEEIVPGIVARPAGAHTEGSMTLHLDTVAGRACICGDALYNVEEQVVRQASVLRARSRHESNTSSCAARRRAATQMRNPQPGADVVYPRTNWPVAGRPWQVSIWRATCASRGGWKTSMSIRR